MSIISSGPEAQDSLFEDSAPKDIPVELRRANGRLQFPPSYIVVGAYRLFADKTLWKPVWDKTKHGLRRGAIVSSAWGFLTFPIQKKFIQFFMSNSPRVTGLAEGTVFGYKIPFDLYTYATVILVTGQATLILKFFLSRNMRIARDRAWDQTVASRGKGPTFWQPYVEEWDSPPVVKPAWTDKIVGGWFAAFIIKKVLLIPLGFVPFFGLVLSAWLKSVGMSRVLHRRYFEAKKMTPEQVAVFMEERKWDYRTFGFAAALLEGLPIIGLVFTVSNRIGAAMWAHDLEKRQHYIASKKQL